MPKRRNENAPYWQQLREAERRIIEYALEHGQTLRGTAAILGISPNYLSERTRELGITVPEVRPGPKPGTKRPAKPALRVVANDPPSDTLDEDADDVIEDEVEEGDEGEGEDDTGDPWEGDGDDDEDENDTEGQPNAHNDAAEGN